MASPIFVLRMDKELIAQTLAPALEKAGCFIVEITVSKANDVTIVIEKDEGSVSFADCEAINGAFLQAFDQESLDYSLTVSSAGLDQPFKTRRQLLKAAGTLVEASLKGGRRLSGELLAVEDGGIVLRHKVLEETQGKKRKTFVEKEELLPLEEINFVKPHIVIEK